MQIRYKYFDSIDSTNNEIKRVAEKEETEGLVISAGEQTAGRGRSGHRWKSPEKSSIATSILLRPQVKIENVSKITIIAAMAVSDAIHELYDLETAIKWPNDVIIKGRKICGILTELIVSDNRIDYVVCGIGVNVHDRDFPEDIKDMATSVDLELEAGGREEKGSRKNLTEKIWECFSYYYEIFEKTEDLAEIKDSYNRLLANKDKEVRVLDPAGEYTGIARGIDESGALMVEKKGQIVKVNSGEVSVRGLYGYV